MRRRPPLEIGAKYNDWVVIRQIDLDREAVELRKLDSKRWTYQALGERYEATSSAVYIAIRNRGGQ